MSADTTLVILKTKTQYKPASDDKRGGVTYTGTPIPIYRVQIVSAVENFDHFKESEPHNLGAYLYYQFGKSPKFYSLAAAMEYAVKLDKDESYMIEYGIKIIELDTNLIFD